MPGTERAARGCRSKSEEDEEIPDSDEEVLKGHLPRLRGGDEEIPDSEEEVDALDVGLLAMSHMVAVLHPTPNTLNPTPNTLHPTPYTQHPKPYTLNPKP